MWPRRFFRSLTRSKCPVTRRVASRCLWAPQKKQSPWTRPPPDQSGSPNILSFLLETSKFDTTKSAPSASSPSTASKNDLSAVLQSLPGARVDKERVEGIFNSEQFKAQALRNINLTNKSPRSTKAAQPSADTVDKIETLLFQRKFNEVIEVCDIHMRQESRMHVGMLNFKIRAYAGLGETDPTAVARALKAFDELQQKYMVLPNAQTFKIMLPLCFNSSLPFFERHRRCGQILARMESLDHPLSSHQFQIIITGYLKMGMVDEALRHHDKMKTVGVTPNQETFRLLLNAVIRSLRCRLAKQLLQEMESTPARPIIMQPIVVPPTLYIGALHAASLADDKEALHFCWQRIFARAPDIFLPRSICSLLLNSCSRTGDVEQGVAVWEYMSKVGIVPCAENHLAFLETYLEAGQLLEALKLANTHHALFPDLPLTAYQRLIDDLSANALIVDNAYYALEELHSNNQPVSLKVLNLLLAACVQMLDVARTQQTFEALQQFGHEPDSDSITLLLSVSASMCEMSNFTAIVEMFGLPQTVGAKCAVFRSLFRHSDPDSTFRMISHHLAISADENCRYPYSILRSAIEYFCVHERRDYATVIMNYALSNDYYVESSLISSFQKGARAITGAPS
eukprot:gnl/Spiro4/2415_TR1159_c0_g1_i1.p1 gnl/Spiro4/2415_TR1159_c0_g1~~gnl/Spiro4/2415_TR1159_c0_g1_i1.p1  ORF type:complete len:626 (+),score=74.07 gnl/Spiro4/2415_TR1159_c0_g1_i1:189-2066(+)